MSIKIEIRYAVLVTLFMMLWLALEFMIGLHEEPLIAYHPYITMFALIIPIVCNVLAVTAKRESLGGHITFAQAFYTGFLITFLVALVSPLVQWIFHTLVNPDFFDSMIAYSIKRAEKNHLNEAQARAFAEGYFNLKAYVMQSAFGTLIGGTVIAAIVALIKRDKK